MVIAAARLRPVARIAALQHLHVAVRAHPVAHRPQHGVRIVRVNILINGHDELAHGPLEAGRRRERVPDLRLLARLHLNDEHLADVGQWLVHAHAHNALDAHLIPQKLEVSGS